jgi:DNA-binding NarL/FixJ family response regulator
MEREATTVLIADRLPQVRAGLRLLLDQSTEWSVAGEVANAASAAKVATERRPDLVLLEWGLPGAKRGAIIGVLRAARPEVTVVALSADPDARRDALNAGADGFVSKLDPPDRLLATMRDCVARKQLSF